MSKSAISVAAALCAVAALFTACSQNAGLAPPPVPGPVAPGPQSSGQVNGSALPGVNGVNASGAPNASPGSSAAPAALTLVSATGRYAYDGSDSDPTKAPRYVELAFALKNATAKAITIAKISVASDAGAAIGDAKLAITLTPGSTSDVTLVAFKMKKDAAFVKSATMTFLDEGGKTIVTGNADLPPTDLPFVPLDPKDPKGSTSVDGVEVSPVFVAGGSPHYEITFALTNAADTKVDIDGFQIGPAKSPLAKTAIPLTIPQRTTTGFISIVMPFRGKTLPDGDYAVNAMNAGATVAKATGAML